MSSKNTILLLVALLPAALLTAQSEPSPRLVADAPKVAPTGDADAVLANWLHVACDNQATLAAVAVKQGHSSEVRAFAQDVLDKHKAFAAKLQPYTVASVGKVEKSTPAEATGKKKGAETGDPRATTTPVPFDHVALVHDLGARCLQSSTKMLASKTGVEFDRCYMRMQVAAHNRDVDTTEVFQGYASERLRATLVEGQKLFAKHLEEAMRLSQQLDARETNGNGHGEPVRKSK